MALYLVKRSDVTVNGQDYEWQALDVQEVNNGEHAVDHHGVHIPFTVDGNTVTVHLAEASGNLTEATVHGMGDDWTLAQRENLRSVAIDVDEKGTAFHIFSDDINTPALLLERHDEAPSGLNAMGRR